MKIIINIGLITVILITGILLHKTGKPYNTGIFAVHKLALVVFLILMVKLFIHQQSFNNLTLFYKLTSGVFGISLLGLLVSGGLMSLYKMQVPMLVVHRLAMVVFLISFAGVLQILHQVKAG